MNDKISMNPAICNGRPVFKGTRITVQTVFEFLSAGNTIEEVLENYPSLKQSDIEAAFEYASRLAGNSITTELVS